MYRESIIIDNVHFTPITENGKDIQTALADLTKQKTVPNVFINGQHIGGCDDVLTAYTKGTLPPLLLEREQMKDNYTKDNIFAFDLIVIGGGSGGLACAKVSRVTHQYYKCVWKIW